MSQFNKIWVNCVEDENLYEKYGFFSDSIDNLINCVTHDILKFWGKLSYTKSDNAALPFVKEDSDTQYRFFYYDPDLYLHKGNPPGRIVTYRELSRWLAQGNGECCYYKEHEGPTSSCFNELLYQDSESNKAVQDILVRKWDTDEWSAPTADYLGLENNK